MALAIAVLGQAPEQAREVLDQMAERLESHEERDAREEEEGRGASEILKALVRAKGPVGR